MPSSALPSYSAATTRPNHWGLIAPYIPVAAYAALCLVSRAMHAYFAPLLWNDPLRMVQLLGLHRDRELSWYLYRFIGQSVKVAAESTRALVLSLDFRHFATATADFLSPSMEHALNDTLRRLPILFPRLRCLLLDGHPAFDPLSLVRANAARLQGPGLQGHKLLLLSIDGSTTELPASYFTSEYTRGLLYLDISRMPGSLRTPLAFGCFSTHTLPCLRVLKARHREIDDSGVTALCLAFGRQLWSLDVSDNKITDVGLGAIVTSCLPACSLWSDAHFDAEGKIAVIPGVGRDQEELFAVIVESAESASFSHPERHFADAPAYLRPNGAGVRPNGSEPILRDGPDDMLCFLAGGAGREPAPDMLEELMTSRHCRSSGLTHLAIGGNSLTQDGLEKMLRLARGALEHLECDMPLMRTSLDIYQGHPGKQSRLYGLLGSSALFRPVISSSLRSLRAHHSIVTQIPTVAAPGGKTSLLEDVWIAEKLLMPRSELAWPGAMFTPDTNPRLAYLTLTNLPRRSAGPIVEKLTHFLELAYEQEQAIDAMRGALGGKDHSRRAPVMLSGLRHLRLEFEPAANVDLEVGQGGRDDPDDLATDTRLDMGEPPSDFSFFDTWAPQSTSCSRTASGRLSPSLASSLGSPPLSASTASPLVAYREPEAAGHEALPSCPDAVFVLRPVHPSLSNLVPVWTGPSSSNPPLPNTHYPPVVAAYTRNVARHPALRTAVGPVTPAQTRAGAPQSVLLFHAAWEAAALLAAIPTVPPLHAPAAAEIATMREVVPELKRFRASARARGRHWTGSLEVVCPEAGDGLGARWR